MTNTQARAPAQRSRRRASLITGLLLGCSPAVVAVDDTTTSSTGAAASTTPAPDPDPLDDSSDDSVEPVPRIDLPPPPDDTSGGPVDPGEIECPTFDPSRVYLLGTLSEGASYMDALTDPTDPTNFCVGFLNYPSHPRIRPADGRVVFIDEWDGGGILEFTPDPIAWNPAGLWDYPPAPYDNDELLLPTPCGSGAALGRLRMSPVDGRAWYSCAGSWFDPDGVLVYASSSPTAVAITPDGRLLVYEQDYGGPLYLVTPGDPLPPTLEVELPRAVRAVLTGRVHAGGTWLVALDDAWRLFRWHLVDETIVEEGEYSDPGIGMVISDVWGGAIDGDGDFFYTASGVGDTFNDVIVRSRLEPDPSEIIYSEAELPETAVRIHISELFTGP